MVSECQSVNTAVTPETVPMLSGHRVSLTLAAASHAETVRHFKTEECWDLRLRWPDRSCPCLPMSGSPVFVSHDVIVIIVSIPLSLMSLRKFVVAISDQDLELIRLRDLAWLPEHQRRVVPQAGPRPGPEQGLQAEAAGGLGAVQRSRAGLPGLHYHLMSLSRRN